MNLFTRHLVKRILKQGRAWTPLMALLWLLPSGCATNPVTGRNELQVVSASQEITLGRQNFLPMQQAEGGEQVNFPEATAYVARVGQSLAQVSDRPELPYEFVVLNNPVPNAWALPGGKIGINRGLLTELQSEAELAAVLSHEIVHAAARHGAKAVERGMLLQAGLVGIGLASQNHDYRDLIVGGAGISAQLLNLRYGRDAEREADFYGMKYMAAAGYEVRAAIDLQRSFVRMTEEKGQGSEGWLAGLLSSHPPSRERVLANERSASAYPAGGRVGREEHQQVVTPLREAAPAYDALAKGYDALAQNRPKQALQLAQQAAGLRPDEAHFFGLEGKARYALGDVGGAIKAFDRAISLNANYFDFYLQRGLLQRELGRAEAAQQDLARSAQLLPTAEAHQALGILALNAGQMDAAMSNLRIAASAPSPAGRSALDTLTRIDLPANPQRYIRLTARRDAQGFLHLRVANASALPVKNVRVTVHILNAEGRIASSSPVLVTDVIASGTGRDAPTRIGPFGTDTQVASFVRLSVDTAAIAE